MRHGTILGKFQKRLKVVDGFAVESLCGGAALDCGDSSPPYVASQPGAAVISALSPSPETSSEHVNARSKAAKNRRNPRTLRVGKAVNSSRLLLQKCKRK